jgi:hypothetical protein
MSIKETLEKIKPFYTPLLFVVLASIFFALGRLSVTGLYKTPINIQYGNEALVLYGQATTTPAQESTIKVAQTNTAPAVKTDGPVIGSKSGKKYYFPWCGTVKRIKLENQVHFASIAEAKSAGFTPGGNCKGLK